MSAFAKDAKDSGAEVGPGRVRRSSRLPVPASGAPSHGLLGLQGSAGNAAVVQMLRQVGHAWTGDQHQHGQGCGHQSETPAVQRSTAHDVLRQSGRPLDEETRSEMESRLGADFSDVRLHVGSAAQRSAAELGARAYTSGSHVVIGAGGGDKHTLAHELTHVIQQRQGPVAGTDRGDGLSVSDPSDRFEQAAEANARRVMSAPAPRSGAGGDGGPAETVASPTGSGSAVVQRVSSDDEDALGRLRRANGRAKGRGQAPFVNGQSQSPFGPYNLREGYGGAPWVTSNQAQHPGSETIGTKYFEQGNNEFHGLVAQLDAEHCIPVADAIRDGRVAPEVLAGMSETQRRAAAMLYGIAREAEERRFPGAAKAIRSALRRQGDPNHEADQFLSDFPMGAQRGAHYYEQVLGGKKQLTPSARQTLEEMSGSSDEDA